MVEFVKGLIVDGKFIPEGATIEATLTTGEIIEGILSKPAKKQFIVVMPDLKRLIEITEVNLLNERLE